MCRISENAPPYFLPSPLEPVWKYFWLAATSPSCPSAFHSGPRTQTLSMIRLSSLNSSIWSAPGCRHVGHGQVMYIYIYIYCQDIPHRKRSNKKHVENPRPATIPFLLEITSECGHLIQLGFTPKDAGSKAWYSDGYWSLFPQIWSWYRFDSYPNMNNMNASQYYYPSLVEKNNLSYPVIKPRIPVRKEGFSCFFTPWNSGPCGNQRGPCVWVRSWRCPRPWGPPSCSGNWFLLYLTTETHTYLIYVSNQI